MKLKNFMNQNNKNNLEMLNKLKNIYKKFFDDIKEHYDKNKDLIDETDRLIIYFKDVADIFALLLKYLLLLCVFIFVIVLCLSFINLVNLIYISIKSSINIFYNTVVINNDTLSFKIKKITKTNKNDFSYDICNVLNEQLTALSVFNMTIYLFYIILAYIFIYILFYIYYGLVMQYTHKFVGSIDEIDPDADYLKLIILIFGLSLVHIIIYRMLLKNLAIAEYKKIDQFENNIDTTIKDFIKKSSIIDNTSDNISENEIFSNLLRDSTKYDQMNLFFENKLKNIDGDGSNIGKFLFMYNLYNYFSSYLIMNDINHYRICRYLGLLDITKEDKEEITFISLLDSNNKRLIKLSHEDLDFYKNIPNDKNEIFKLINNEVINIITSINKLIITYSGTFTIFIYMAIYIIVIFIYNAICVYILFEGIQETRNKNLFPTFIHNFIDFYKKL